jgi:hypothetical protein
LALIAIWCGNGEAAHRNADFKGFGCRHVSCFALAGGAMVPISVRRPMMADAHDPALQFFEVRDNQFIPALLEGGRQQAESLMPALRASYENHRKA